MFSGSSAAAYAALLFLVLLRHHSCNAARNINNHCAPSSCGGLHNINYPFRLKTDPENCGEKMYELECDNNSRAVLYLHTARYYVQAINRNNLTIRLADADVQKDNCSSIPHHSLSYNDSGGSEYQYDSYCLLDRRSVVIWQRLIFLTCANPVSSPLYVDTSSCNSDGTYTNSNSTTRNSSSSGHLTGRYSYVMATGVSYADLMDSCRVDLMVMTSLLPKNSTDLSYKEVHDSMVYGFELSWWEGCCESVQENRCNLDADVARYVLMFCPEGNIHTAIRLISSFLANHILNYLGVWAHSRYFQEGWISYPRWGNPRLEFDVATGKDGYSNLEGSSFSIFFIILLLTLLAFIVLYRGLLFICGVPCLIALLIYKWLGRHKSMYHVIEEFLQNYDNLMPVRYSYSEIKKITKGFKNKLGEGGYGSVYKGKLRSSRFAAIKMLNKSKADGQEFMNEVATIGRIHHVNVVQLIGFCAEGSKRALIYEFMPNGSLDKYIFSREGSIALSNKKMFEISLGIARGIEYLHRGCDMQILHFDIKPHNILLDENFVPKVSDFGLAKLYPTNNSIVSLTAARGTMGYMAPELFYRSIGGVSYKADVYSFGRMLMEMVERRKNLKAFAEQSSHFYFPSWVHDQFSEGKDIELGDVTEQERKTTKKMVIVALWCIQLKPNDRPSMQKVVEMLEAEVEHIQMPPKPSLSTREMPEDARVDIGSPTSLTDPLINRIDSSYQYGR